MTPSHRERYCLTIWLDSDLANDGAHVLPWPGMADHLSPGLAQFAKPSVQRNLARAVYAEEYEVCVCICVGVRLSPSTRIECRVGMYIG